MHNGDTVRKRIPHICRKFGNVRPRAHVVTPGSKPEQPIRTPIVSLYGLHDRKSPPSVPIDSTERLNLGFAERFSVAVVDPAGYRTGRKHGKPNVRHPLARDHIEADAF